VKEIVSSIIVFSAFVDQNETFNSRFNSVQVLLSKVFHISNVIYLLPSQSDKEPVADIFLAQFQSVIS
jgi:hypothetical protein